MRMLMQQIASTSSRRTCPEFDIASHPFKARPPACGAAPDPLGWVDGHRRPHRDRAGRPDPSAGAYIAAIQRKLAEQDKVGYRMHAMGTSLEGSTEDILAVVGELHAVPFELGLPRVYTVLKLDERRDRPEQTLDDKVASVERRLAEDAADAPTRRDARRATAGDGAP